MILLTEFTGFVISTFCKQYLITGPAATSFLREWRAAKIQKFELNKEPKITLDNLYFQFKSKNMINIKRLKFQYFYFSNVSDVDRGFLSWYHRILNMASAESAAPALHS